MTCHTLTTQERKLGKFSDCQSGNWTSPVSVSGVSLSLMETWDGAPWFWDWLSSLVISEMRDVTLGNSPVIKILLYGPLEELISSHTFISDQTDSNNLHLRTTGSTGSISPSLNINRIGNRRERGRFRKWFMIKQIRHFYLSLYNKGREGT